MQLNYTYLRSLDSGQLDRIMGLNANGDTLREYSGAQIVTDLAECLSTNEHVIEALDTKDEIQSFLWGQAQTQVPTYIGEVVATFALVGEAWSTSPDDAGADTGASMVDVMQSILGHVFEQALFTLWRDVCENTAVIPDHNESDDDADLCDNFEPNKYADSESVSPGDYAECPTCHRDVETEALDSLI